MMNNSMPAKNIAANSLVFSISQTFVLVMLSFNIVAAEIPTLPGSNKLSVKAQLGRQLFFDTNLSSPPGQACASCHNPNTFFVDPDHQQPTSDGVLSELKGARNSPMLHYAAYSPSFHFDRNEGLYIGGFFLDGRAKTLADQAKGPFLNPTEMANPDIFTVVNKVAESDYKELFTRVYGVNAFNDTSKAYNKIADAIAAFERSPVFRRFNSKYDYFLAGKTKFTAQEKRGRKLFEDPDKGNCAACHPSRPGQDGAPPLFTDFSYDNLGVPRNPENPFYDAGVEINPTGRNFIDKGLGKFVGEAAENGKFKVPSLRNIAKTGPYMHNGYFKTLKSVVMFYNNRDLLPTCKAIFASAAEAIAGACWPAPEVIKNVNVDELGNLGLNNTEIDDIVAFLNTLTDGYKVK
ncbi:MAG: cytochrome c peroxidase [Methylococcales bacterium]